MRMMLQALLAIILVQVATVAPTDTRTAVDSSATSAFSSWVERFLPGITLDSHPTSTYSFPTNVPGIIASDLTRPFTFLGKNTIGPAEDSPGGLVFLSKELNYVSLTSGDSTTLSSNLTYRDGPNVQAAAIAANAFVFATSNSQGDGIHSGAALALSGFCQVYVVNGIDCWGLINGYYEHSGTIIAPGAYSGTPDPTHAEYGQESDIYAGGTDKNQQRIVHELSCNNAGFQAAPALGPTHCFQGLQLATGNLTTSMTTSTAASTTTKLTVDSVKGAVNGSTIEGAGSASGRVSVVRVSGNTITTDVDVKVSAGAPITIINSGGVYDNMIGGAGFAINGINWTRFVGDDSGNALAWNGYRVDWHGNVKAQKGIFDTMSANFFKETLTTPASSSAACAAGQFTDDANYHYVCVETNKWKRVALSAF